MIITKLTGGIGNQLFQYALGRHLSVKNKDVLFFDISEFENKKQKRKYCLKYFNIEEKFIYDTVFLNIKPTQEKSWFIFDSSVLDEKENVLLSGFWQNEKYFMDIKNLLIKELTLKKEYEFDIFDKTEGTIERENTVSVHVRRGDYIKNENIKKTFDVCNADYYAGAIEKMSSILENPVFLFFSDDIDWVKKNIKINFPSFFMERNEDYEDFAIMQKCKHNIIANSSFSWWSAWLNENKSKKVIAPKKWLNDEKVDSSNIIPQSWIRL